MLWGNILINVLRKPKRKWENDYGMDSSEWIIVVSMVDFGENFRFLKH